MQVKDVDDDSVFTMIGPGFPTVGGRRVGWRAGRSRLLETFAERDNTLTTNDGIESRHLFKMRIQALRASQAAHARVSNSSSPCCTDVLLPRTTIAKTTH
jgi:hypothetical protein